METSQEFHVLKCQLHEKWKQVKKAEKQARIKHLYSQLAETDHKLDMLRQDFSTIHLGQEFWSASTNKHTPDNQSPGQVIAPTSRH